MRIGLLLATAFLGVVPVECLAQEKISGSAREAMVVPAVTRSARSFSFLSKINGATYRVDIFTPRAPPPASGYPVIFLLDGDALFGTFAEAVRTRAQAGEIDAAVVVGISGAGGEQGGDRTLDFSPSDLSTSERTIITDLDSGAKYGGAERFFHVIDDEIRPRIGDVVKVDPKRTTLAGWSLGGMFVARTLLNHPDAFQRFVALSPSVWWNGRAILKELPSFRARMAREQLRPIVFIGVGGLEQQLPPGLPARAASTEAIAREIMYARMVDNAREFAAALVPRASTASPTVTFRLFAGETHNSVPWRAINPVLDFALRPEGR